MISFICIFGMLQLTQSRLPAPLQLGGHEAVVGVGLLVLALDQSRLVAKPFELLPFCPVDLLAFLGKRAHDPVVDVQFRRSKSLEEETDDVVVDRVTGDALTDRDLALLPERVAQVLGPALVLNRPSCGRTRRSRRGRAEGPSQAAGCPGSCSVRTRCGCRRSWPGFSHNVAQSM